MRVNSDKQTLILAGEAIPRRDAARSSAPLQTLVATRADNTMLLAHGDSASPAMALATGGQNTLERSGYLPSARSFSFNAANEYARTQDSWGTGIRSTTIDTYA
jgi:hypothetical protein